MEGRAEPAFFGRYPVKIVRIEPKGRLIAVSDIHGRADLFEALVRRLDLRGEDRLVIAGDLIERGGESLRAVRLAMQLCRSGRAIALMGNMDAHRVWQMDDDGPDTEQDLWYNAHVRGASLFRDMCCEAGLPFATPQQAGTARAKLRGLYARELDFLRTRPTILDTPAWTVVHGGLPRPDFEALAGQEAFACMKFDDFANRGPVCRKNTVVGHFPVGLYRPGALRLDPYWRVDKRVLSIDGGCGLRVEGQLNAVFLQEDGSWEYTAEDDLEEVLALEDQPGREARVRFCWPESEAELLEERACSALVRRKATGRVCTAPNAFWKRTENGLLGVNDLSDARLAVSAGEKIAVIARTEDGLYAKKNGCSGWYGGKTKQIK